MRLEIFLNRNYNKERFIQDVYACVDRGQDFEESEIRTWVVWEVTTINNNTIKGFRHHESQYSNNGLIKLSSAEGFVSGVLIKNRSDRPTSEAEAIILFKFASMLHRHFSDNILTISLTGI